MRRVIPILLPLLICSVPLIALAQEPAGVRSPPSLSDASAEYALRAGEVLSAVADMLEQDEAFTPHDAHKTAKGLLDAARDEAFVPLAVALSECGDDRRALVATFRQLASTGKGSDNNITYLLVGFAIAYVLFGRKK